MRVFPLFLCLLLILTACAVTGQAGQVSGEQPVSTLTPTRLLAPSAVDPAFESGILLSLQNEEEQRSEIRLVDPTTGESVAGYPPITLGLTTWPTPVLSADGKKLAALESQGRSCETYMGGRACRWSADVLHLVGLPAWHEMAVAIPGKGWVELVTFSPDAAHLALVQNAPESSTLMVYDADTGELVAQRILDFRPSLLTYTRNGMTLVVYGQPLGVPPGMGRPDSPQVRLFNALTLEVLWDRALETVLSGHWCQEECLAPHGAPLFAEWKPAVVPSRDGHRLYIVHADEERLTTVDFDTEIVRSVLIRAERSWFERLLALTASIAEAKGGVTGTIKKAVISVDGTQLYVIGQAMNSTRDADGNWEAVETQLGLQVIDVESGRSVASHDIEVAGTWISVDGIRLTPDGAHLVVNAWRIWEGESTGWTEVLGAKNLERLVHLDGWEVVFARRMDSQPVILARRWRNEKPPKLEFAVLDPRTFDIINTWVATEPSRVTP
jgi:hypothetical protein